MLLVCFKKMSSNCKFRDHDQLYFATLTIVCWVDLFIRNEYRDILINSWEFCQQKKQLELSAWCMMTSHVHMMIGSHQNKLDDIMRDTKKYTSFELKKVPRAYYSGEGLINIILLDPILI